MDWFWQKKPVDLIKQCVADWEAIRPEPTDVWQQIKDHMDEVLHAAPGWCAPSEPDYSLTDILNANGKVAVRMKSLDALKMESLWE